MVKEKTEAKINEGGGSAQVTVTRKEQEISGTPVVSKEELNVRGEELAKETAEARKGMSKEEIEAQIRALKDKADRLNAEGQTTSVDLNKMEIIPEIASKLDYLEVTNKRNDRRYLWVYSGNGGQEVELKKMQGWRMIEGNPKNGGDRECSELYKSDITSCRRIGDTLLMWTSVENYNRIMKAQDEKNAFREGSVKNVVLGEDGKPLPGVMTTKDGATISTYGFEGGRGNHPRLR